MDATTRKKVLQVTFAKLNKKYGEGTVINTEEQKKYETISTGSLVLDEALGNNGLVEGKIIEIAGPSGSGKSSLCYSLVAQAQKKHPDKLVLYVDVEQGVNLEYMSAFGVDISESRLIFVQPEYIEKSFEIIEEFVNTGLISLVILDSVGNSVTKSILEKSYDEATMGALAKAVATGLTKLNPIVNQTNTLFVLVNTEYAKLTYMGGNETKGGASMKFMPTTRMRISKRDLLQNEDNKEDIVGQEIFFKIVKNRMAQGNPFREGSIFLYFGKGFDQISEITDLAVNFNLINRGGAWFSFKTKDNTDVKFQGKAKVVEYFKNNPEDFEHYKQLVQNYDTGSKNILTSDTDVEKEE